MTDELKPCSFCEHRAAHIKKLERRIHNQRVALRENWMITEMRMKNSASPRYRPLRSMWWEYVKKQAKEIKFLKSKIDSNEPQTHSALREAIRLRVALWRHGDVEGDDDKLTDEQVAMKDTYAKKWMALLPPSAANEETK